MKEGGYKEEYGESKANKKIFDRKVNKENQNRNCYKENDYSWLSYDERNLENYNAEDISWIKYYDENPEETNSEDLSWIDYYDENPESNEIAQEPIEPENEENRNNVNAEVDKPCSSAKIDEAKEENVQEINEKSEENSKTVYFDDKKSADKDEEIQNVKEQLKNIDWDEISDDWTIKSRPNSNKTIQLDPTQDCSKENPLYRHKAWLEHVYNNKEWDLSDRQLAKICGLKSHRSVGEWRDKLNITTKEEKARYITSHGYIELYMPEDYQHPELKPSPSGRIKRKEHELIMENFLAEHSDLDVSKECLIDGKYLKLDCEIHHINHIRTDNRRENLWAYKNKSEHGFAQRSRNDSFSGLIKLGQIEFDNGEYKLNEEFDLNSLDSEEIKEKIKPVEFKKEMSIEEINKEIKKIDWSKISNDWEVWKVSNQFGEVKMPVDPNQDCSNNNPLYRHKEWVETIVKDKKFNLTDPRLAELCNISERTAYRWRWEKHEIPTYYNRWGNVRTLNKNKSAGDRIWIKLPEDYKNPFAAQFSRHNMMPEHRYVMEKYLAEHPEGEISKESLLEGKYLKPDYIVHHINLDTIDNRVENLWVTKGTKGHNKVHKSLLKNVDSLLKSGPLDFKEGKYYLKFEK